MFAVIRLFSLSLADRKCYLSTPVVIIHVWVVIKEGWLKRFKYVFSVNKRRDFGFHGGESFVVLLRFGFLKSKLSYKCCQFCFLNFFLLMNNWVLFYFAMTCFQFSNFNCDPTEQVWFAVIYLWVLQTSHLSLKLEHGRMNEWVRGIRSVFV